MGLTDLIDDQVIELLTKFTRYQDYVSGQLVEAEINESSAVNLLDVAKAQHMVGAWTGASTDRVTLSKAEALLDQRVKECSELLSQLKARRKLLGVMVEALARDAAVVSREISRRIGREGIERRVDHFKP